jgi:hypothetical protein
LERLRSEWTVKYVSASASHWGRKEAVLLLPRSSRLECKKHCAAIGFARPGLSQAGAGGRRELEVATPPELAKVNATPPRTAVHPKK